MVEAYYPHRLATLEKGKRMKRTIWIWIALLMMSASGTAQTVNGLFNQFEDQPGAECKSVGSLLMKLVKAFADNDSDEEEVVKSIKSIKVLDLEDCAADIKQDFSQKARNLKPRGMELLMHVKDEDGNVSIWGKMKKETVRQLLIVTPDKLVRIKGRFDLSQISNVINVSNKD